MRIIKAFTAAALWAALAPIAVAAPAAPAPPWETGRFEGTPTCFVAREDQGGILVLIADQQARLWAAIGHPSWSAEEGESYEVGIEIDGKRRPVQAGSGLRSMGLRGFLVQVNRGFVRAIGRGRAMRVSPPGAPPLTLNLEGGAGAAAQLMRCYNFPGDTTFQSPGAGTFAASPLRDPFRRNHPFPRRAAGAFERYITPDDYPAASIRNREQGRVTYRVEASAEGRIAGCSIVRSSGSAALDAATCAILLRRARVQPALDASGKPVADSIQGHIEWRLGK
jgi:protein TonB